jgi:hypothetical protein
MTVLTLVSPSAARPGRRIQVRVPHWLCLL